MTTDTDSNDPVLSNWTLHKELANDSIYDSNGSFSAPSYEYDGSMPFGPPPQPSEIVLRLQEILWVLRIYYIPALVGFGFIGNVMGCLIMLRSKLTGLSCVHYLSAILVSDILFLFNLLCLWAIDIGTDLYVFGAWCHLTIFISHSSSFLSLWYTVCLALDRLMHMHYTNMERRCCSSLRARILILAFAFVAIAVFLNMSLTYGVVYVGSAALCTPLTRFYKALHTLSQVDVFLNCLIPYIFLMAVFFLGVVKVYSKHKSRRLDPTRRIPRRVHIYEGDYEKGQQLGPLCFIGFYLLLTIPSQSFRFFMTIKEMTGAMNTVNLEMILTQQVLQYLQYARYSLNIVILLVFFSGFRVSTRVCFGSLKQWICCALKCSRPRRKACDIEDLSERTPSRDLQDDSTVALYEIKNIQEGTV